MALFLLSEIQGWIRGQFNFTELSLRYQSTGDDPKMADRDVGAFGEVSRRGRIRGFS